MLADMLVDLIPADPFAIVPNRIGRIQVLIVPRFAVWIHVHATGSRLTTLFCLFDEERQPDIRILNRPAVCMADNQRSQFRHAHAANPPLVERAHGLMTCAEGSNTSINTYQWDAPNAWPPLQTAAITGLLRYGYTSDAKRLAEKYVLTCARNLASTGRLWEKYNALTGRIDVANEYEMPQMMGWTAGGFLHAAEVLEK